VLAFNGAPSMRSGARAILVVSWLGNAVATVACVRHAFARPSTGIGNQVFLLVALPVAFFTILWFALWRAASRHAYVQSLPDGLRRVEELADIERSLEAAMNSLASDEQRLKSWTIDGEEREQLRFNIGILRTTIARLEEERAKRLEPTG